MNNAFPIDQSVARVAESVSPSAELRNSLDAKRPRRGSVGWRPALKAGPAALLPPSRLNLRSLPVPSLRRLGRDSPNLKTQPVTGGGHTQVSAKSSLTPLAPNHGLGECS